jgi:hypothetical protein
MQAVTVESIALATVVYDESRDYCRWGSVVGRSIITSAFLRQCTKGY